MQVEPGGTVYRAGVRRGDILLEVQGASITTHAGGFSALESLIPRGPRRLKIKRRHPIAQPMHIAPGGATAEAARVRLPANLSLWHVSLSGAQLPSPLLDGGGLVNGEAPSQPARSPMVLSAVASPNGHFVAYADADASLHLHRFTDGVTHTVCHGRHGIGTAFEWNRPFKTIAWSADSAWFSYTAQGGNSMQQVFVVRATLPPSEPIPVTSDRFNSWSPSWSLDGKWLYFLSDRDLIHSQDVFGTRAEQPSLMASVTIYAIPRDPSAHPPWRFVHEFAAAAAAAAHDAAEERERAERAHPGWGFAGGPKAAAQRVVHVPVPLGAYRRLQCVAEGRLLLFGALNSELLVVDVPKAAEHGDLEAKFLLRGVSEHFKVTPNGKNILIEREGSLYVGTCGWPAGATDLQIALGDAQRLRTSDILLRTQPDEEWREILADAWRQARDSFWDRTMGGVDWEAVYCAHAALLPRVGCRSELADLIRSMYSELRVLHLAVVSPSGRVAPAHAPAHPPAYGPATPPLASLPDSPAYLGAEMRAAAERDGSGRGVEVVHMYAGDIERQQLSPLLMPYYGERVREGERIVAVNGSACTSLATLGELLLGQAHRQVRLRLIRPCDWRAETAHAADDAAGARGGPSAIVTSAPSASGVVETAVSILTSSLGVGGAASGLLAAAGLGGGSPRSSSRAPAARARFCSEPSFSSPSSARSAAPDASSAARMRPMSSAFGLSASAASST